VKESGFTFAIPTYFFVVSMFITVGWAFTAMLPVRLERCESPAFSLEGARLQSTPWLLLHAFSNGTSALTASRRFRTIMLSMSLVQKMPASP